MLDFTVGRAPAGQEPWREKIAQATRIVVASLRQFDRTPAEIRRQTIEAARECLSDAPGGEMVADMRTGLRNPDDDTDPEHLALTMAGVFRLVCVNFPIEATLGNLDMIAESVLDVIRKTLDTELEGA